VFLDSSVNLLFCRLHCMIDIQFDILLACQKLGSLPVDSLVADWAGQFGGDHLTAVSP